MLEQYSLVCQSPGTAPFTVCAYTGTAFSQVLGITQAKTMPEGSYGWIQELGDGVIEVDGTTQSAYVDFRPNTARLPMNLDEKGHVDHQRERLSQLPALLIETGPYCNLLREARDVFVDGHFYACVAMCGICLERIQRDKVKPYSAEQRIHMDKVRALLQRHNVLTPKLLRVCELMADLRNAYAHGEGLNPREDASRALAWMHTFIDETSNLMRDFVIINGRLTRKGTIAP